MIRRALPSEAYLLTQISFSSKGIWDYPLDYYDIWQDELTITETYINENHVFVYLMDDTIVGYYSIINIQNDLKIGASTLESGYWLEHMFILPAQIKSGIGSTFFHHCIEYCKTHSIKKISVLSDPNARFFYEKLGFIYAHDLPSSIPGRTTPLLHFEI